jgi:hypothetical protein
LCHKPGAFHGVGPATLWELMQKSIIIHRVRTNKRSLRAVVSQSCACSLRPFQVSLLYD